MSALTNTQINLLPEAGFLTTTSGRVLAWVLSTFRVIVILTEIVVVLAFLSRFFLDSRNTDLNELVNQKKEVIASTLDFEKEYRDIQKRLTIFSDLSSDKNLISPKLNLIYSHMEPDIFLQKLSYQEGRVQLNGQSGGERGVQQFIVNLKSSGAFQEVNLVQVTTEEPGLSLTEFQLELVFKVEAQEL